ncbi:sigma-70 family RNA polymerase sigma factor [Spirillospora sp. NBC_00431]
MDFELLYRTHWAAVERLVKRAGATNEEAMDAVQSAFAKLLLAAYRIDEPKAWLAKVALNEFCNSTLRFSSSRRETTERATAPHHVPEPAGRYSPSAAEVAAHNEEHRQALTEIATLPGKQRLVLEGHYFGLTHEQIGALFGMNPEAVRQNLSRARRTLRNQRAKIRKDTP